MELKKLLLSGLASTAAFSVLAGQVHADEITDSSAETEATTTENETSEAAEEGATVSPATPEAETFVGGIIDDSTGNTLADVTAESQATLQAALGEKLDNLGEKYEVVDKTTKEENGTYLLTIHVKPVKEDEPMTPLQPAQENFQLGVVLQEEGKEDKTLAIENFQGTEEEANKKLMDLYIEQAKKGYSYVKTIKGEGNNWGIVVKPAEKEEEEEDVDALKEKLQGLVEKAEKLDTVLINLKKATTEGKALLAKEDVKPAELKAAIENLEKELDKRDDIAQKNVKALKAQLKKLVKKVDGFETTTIDLYKAKTAALALLEKEEATPAELTQAIKKLEKEIKIKEELDKEDADKTPAEREVETLKDLVAKTEKLDKMTIDVHKALNEAKELLKKDDITYDEAHAALEKLFFALEDMKQDTDKEDNKPGEKPEQKPDKDWNDLIDWDKLEALLSHKNNHKGDKKEDVKHGQKENNKLPQTGAAASVAPAALGLALAAVGAGFAFRKRD